MVSLSNHQDSPFDKLRVTFLILRVVEQSETSGQVLSAIYWRNEL